MGSHSTHSKKEVKKGKKGAAKSPSTSGFSTRPVFTPPGLVKDDTKR